MGISDDLAELARLHREGGLTDEEFAQAKALVLSRGAEADHYPVLTYRALTQTRRRLAVLFLLVALVAGAVALVSAVRYVQLRDAAAAVEDRALVERFGIRVPDPRPPIERAELRFRASLRGTLALTAGTLTAAALLGWFVLRPAATPRTREGPPRPSPGPGPAD